MLFIEKVNGEFRRPICTEDNLWYFARSKLALNLFSDYLSNFRSEL